MVDIFAIQLFLGLQFVDPTNEHGYKRGLLTMLNDGLIYTHSLVVFCYVNALYEFGPISLSWILVGHWNSYWAHFTVAHPALNENRTAWTKRCRWSDKKKMNKKSVDGARRSRADGNTLGPMKLHPGDERELCSIFRVREPPPKKVKNKRKECTAWPRKIERKKAQRIAYIESSVTMLLIGGL